MWRGSTRNMNPQQLGEPLTQNRGNHSVNTTRSDHTPAASLRAARHVNETPAQSQHEQSARGDRQLQADVNNGKPVIAVTTKPAQLYGHSVVPATSAAPYNPPPPRSASSNASPAQQCALGE